MFTPMLFAFNQNVALLSYFVKTSQIKCLPIQALAHSLDEHKRLAVAKQNQELLLSEHFAEVNIKFSSGEQLESENFITSSKEDI